ncbi:MAG: ATP-binding protein [Sphaerochaeta sp.]|nr:ATP-binding protein [Sphaerochaeta sp.]
MLSYFTIENFKSIQHLTLDLSFAEAKAPQGYKDMAMISFLQEKGSPRTVSCLGLFGANGSGKSNIIEAFALFTSITASGLAGFSYKPNRLAITKLSPTSLELGFFFGGSTYQYCLTYDQTGIVSERLVANGTTIFSYTEDEHEFSYLTVGVYTSEKLEEIFRVQATYQHAFLAVLATGFAGLSREVTTAFSYITNHMGVLSKVKSSVTQFFMNYQRKAGDPPNFDPLVRILNMLDIDIVRIEKRQGFEEGFIAYHHNGEGGEVAFDSSEESEGTQRLFRVLDMALDCLATGCVAVIDNLDLLLHPRLSIELVRMFKDRRLNTKAAQLVFTANSTELLSDELLRVSEIGIVSKTLKNGSIVRRISDFAGEYNAHDFRKNYLNGKYGGIPFPYL